MNKREKREGLGEGVDVEYGGDQAMTRLTQFCHEKEKQNKVEWERW
jgi:hypothetical protein